VTRRKQRMLMISAGLAVVFAAAALVISALDDTLTFFYGPTELTERNISPNQRVRLGGLVMVDSLTREGNHIRFIVSDGNAELPVLFNGVLPDLFREGQGVVAEGHLSPDGSFAADTILAKHDETYMPKNVADLLKKNGEWRSSQ